MIGVDITSAGCRQAACNHVTHRGVGEGGYKSLEISLLVIRAILSISYSTLCLVKKLFRRK